MPKFIADLEIHSKYARAVSEQMVLENLAPWAVKKGIGVIGTGDFTHPLWFKDINQKLEPAESGLFRLKKEYAVKNESRFDSQKARFILSGEVSCIYSKNNKVRRVHHLIYAPSIEAAEKINTKLSWIGNLKSDGRPMLGLDSKELLKILLEASPDSVLIPAHVWTPWFGIFGSKTGFDSLQECFDELTPHIFAIETGLSSDPPMNWRIPFLDDKAIMSSSDSHSLSKIGREATIFNTELSYASMMKALRTRSAEFIGTIEFFPEEGKYHFDGHRLCNISWNPQETKKHKGICPVCGKPVTIGVMARIEELAAPQRPQGFRPAWAKTFYSLVPFDQVIAEALGVGDKSKSVRQIYEKAVNDFGSEFGVLLDANESELKAGLPERVAEGVILMRQGKLKIKPGYDGEYGKVSIFSEASKGQGYLESQSSLF